jgi:hypothetical protein
VPDGDVPRSLSPKANGDSIPTWSRDGKWIYASSQDRENGDIYKIPLEGGAPKQIAKAAMIIGNAKESEDGLLYYAKGDGKVEIRVVSSNGGEDHPVTGMPTAV